MAPKVNPVLAEGITSIRVQPDGVVWIETTGADNTIKVCRDRSIFVRLNAAEAKKLIADLREMTR